VTSGLYDKYLFNTKNCQAVFQSEIAFHIPTSSIPLGSSCSASSPAVGLSVAVFQGTQSWISFHSHSLVLSLPSTHTFIIQEKTRGLGVMQSISETTWAKSRRSQENDMIGQKLLHLFYWLISKKETMVVGL
jgi:hypothetical protein